MRSVYGGEGNVGRVKKIRRCRHLACGGGAWRRRVAAAELASEACVGGVDNFSIELVRTAAWVTAWKTVWEGVGVER